MSKHLEPLPKPGEKNVQSYVAGFAFSVALTMGAFALVWAYRASDGQVYSRGWLIAFLTMLAIVQLMVQALFFLHVSAERRVRLNLYSAVFTVMVVLAIVLGSIWIMQNLDYNMGPHNTTEYVQHEEGIQHP